MGCASSKVSKTDMGYNTNHVCTAECMVKSPRKGWQELKILNSSYDKTHASIIKQQLAYWSISNCYAIIENYLIPYIPNYNFAIYRSQITKTYCQHCNFDTNETEYVSITFLGVFTKLIQF